MRINPLDFFDRDNIDSFCGVVNEDHLSIKELLMKVIMGDEALSEVCLEFIKSDTLFYNEKKADSDLWKVFYFSIEYMCKYKTTPSDEIVYSDLKEKSSDSAIQKKSVSKLLKANFVSDVDWAKEQLFFRIEAVYKVKVIRLASLGPDSNFSELIAIEKELFEKQVARLLKSSFRLTNAYDSILGVIESHVKEPIGIPWLDQMLGGGLSPAEQMLFIVPSGGGKSTLAWQIVAAAVDVNKKSLYCSFEQELDGDFALRTRVLSTQMGRSEWGKPLDQLSSLAISRAKEARPLWLASHRYAYLGDPKEKIPSAQAFIEFLEDVRKTFPFEYLIVDWLGLFTKKVIRDSKMKGDTFGVKFINAEIIDATAKFAREHSTKGIFFHQRGGQANKNREKATSNDAAGDADLDQLFDYAFTATPRGDDGTFKIINGKSRSSAVTYKILKMNGEMCRIEPADSITDFDIPGNEQFKGHYRSKFPLKDKFKPHPPTAPAGFGNLNKGV